MATLDGFVELLMWGLGIMQVYLPFVLVGLFLTGIGIVILAVGMRSGMAGKLRGAIGRLI